MSSSCSTERRIRRLNSMDPRRLLLREHLCTDNLTILRNRKKSPSLVFYTTQRFKKRTEPAFVIPDPESSHHDIVPSMDKSRFDNWDFDYEYDVVEREPVQFIYNETGVLWEERMGLDFFKDNWYDDYMEIRERLYNNHSRYECFLFHDVGTSKRSWRRSGKSEFISVGSLCRSKGYSRFITTKNFAFVSNACVHVRNGQVTLHMKSDRQLNLLLSDYKWKDFYCTCKSRDSM